MMNNSFIADDSRDRVRQLNVVDIHLSAPYRAGESVLKVRGLNDIVTKEAPPWLGRTGRKIFEIMVLYIGLEVV